MSLETGQRVVVHEHFKNASARWGSRYSEPPQRMSDLDLLLRRENVHRLLGPLIEDGPPLRILDLGCGTGDVLDGLPRNALRVTGVDFVPEMVAEAARLHPADRFAVADATRLPFAPASMDIITCLGVLEYVPDPRRALRMCWEILRPGGHLIVSFPNKGSWLRTLSNAEIQVEQTLSGWVNRVRGRSSEAAQPKYRHSQWSVQEARHMLADAGFEPVEIVFNTFGLWGRIGRSALNMNLCRWMSKRFYRHGFISARSAFTMVIKAAKPLTR